MADFNATFANNDNCTLGNLDGTFMLCDCRQICDNSLRRLNKDRRKRAKKTFTAGENCCRGHKNTLTCR